MIAAAITGYTKRDRQTTHVRVGRSTCGLFRSSTILLQLLCTLDKSRLSEYIGSVDEEKMREVDTALGVSFGLQNT